MFPNLPIMVMKTVLRIELSKKPVSVKEVYSKIPFADLFQWLLQDRHTHCSYQRMGNLNLLPYETIVRATNGEPEAVDEVLQHYSKRIRIAAIENVHIDRDPEDSIKSRLAAALFKFRFDKHEV